MTRSRDTANIIPTVDAKGDLIVGSADNTVAKLAVGAEGTVLLADPSTPTGLAWGAAGGSISVSTTAPEDPAEGDLWFNSANATTYIYYDSFWVEISEAKLGPTGLPGVVIQDGQPTDSNVLWLDTDEESLAPVPAGGTTGQLLQKTSSNNYETAWVNPPSGNAIINGGFDIWQRGTSSATGGFLPDRFRFDTIGGQTATQSRQSFTPGELSATSSSGANFYYRLAISTASGYQQFATNLEDVQLFAGQTVTISYYAKAAAAGGLISNLFIDQNFGSGGSSAVNTIASVGGHPSLTTSWARYSFTVAVPSINGKTIGTNSSLTVRLLINGTGTLDIWGVQLEAGSTATPFRRNANSPQGELAACQRYYQRVTATTAFGNLTGTGSARTTTSGFFMFPLKTTLRAAPTSTDVLSIAFDDGASALISATSVTLAGVSPDCVVLLATAASGLTQFRPYTLIASNNSAAFIGVSAEL